MPYGVTVREILSFVGMVGTKEGAFCSACRLRMVNRVNEEGQSEDV